jgi:hypothetical protein
MTSYISDPFQVKRLEKLAKRKLTELELAGEEAVRFKDVNGKVHFEWIRKYNFKDFYSR